MITRYVNQSSQTSTDVSILIGSLVLALEQCGFTEVTPTGSGNIKAVQFNSLILEFQPHNNGIKIYNYIEYGSETKTLINSDAIGVCKQTSNMNISPLSFNLYTFYSDDGKFFAFNIAGYNTQIGKGRFIVFDIKTDDDDELLYLYGTTDAGYYSTQQYRATASLKRNYAKETNILFLDEGVPILNSSNNNYVMDLPYLTTLGGAEAGYTYTMLNGDNYYCLLDNIAIKFDTTVFPQTGT